MHILMIECNPNGFAGIANALQLGHHVTFVSADPDFYLNVSPLTRAAYDHPNCKVIKSADTFFIDALVALAKGIHADKPVDGVTTYSEYHTVHTASVAQALGLPGMDVEGALNARHKHRTRLKLAGTGVRQPRFAHVPKLDHALIEAAVREVGFPCVIKPSDGSASLHVLHLTCEAELASYLAELSKVVDYGRSVVRIPDILVEEFIEGELVSVEACVHKDGRIVNLGVTDRCLSGFPYFIEMGATYLNDHAQQAELFAMNEQVLRGLGIDFGFIHAEYILGKNGPVLCEVNARLIGGIVPGLMKISSGVDPYLEVIRQALGEEPQHPIPGKVVASVRWFGSPVDGTLSRIDLEKLKTLPGYQDALSYRVPGRPVSKLSKSNFDWVGHLVFTGASREEASGRCEAALDLIDLEIAVGVAR